MKGSIERYCKLAGYFGSAGSNRVASIRLSPRWCAYLGSPIDEFGELDGFPKISDRSKSRCTRSWTGGYRLKRPVPGPKMLRPQADGAGGERSASFSRADARGAGFPVVRPLDSSARSP